MGAGVGYILGNNNPVSPCTQCTPNTPDSESLASAVGNFIYHFFGSLTKTVDSTGNIIWALPCDLTTGIAGNPRITGEGLACYFKRLLEEGVVGKNGQNAFASTLFGVTQPAVGATVDVLVSDVAPFAVNQYVWLEVGGFYTVQSITGNTATLLNLIGPPANLGAGGSIPGNVRIFPSGPAAVPGPKGDKGDAGTPAVNAFAYIAYADDNAGTNFHLNSPVSTSKYFALKLTTVAISSPASTDFTGLWTRYQGADGATGPAGAAIPQTWEFLKPGTHKWVCPTGVTQLRTRVYGAGGGGGGGASTAHGSGNGYGGGGGEYSQGVVPVSAGTTYSILVGAGGAGGTGGDSTANGGDGADSKIYSSVTTFLIARGGKGGTAAVASSPAVGVGGTGGSGSVVPEVPNQPGTSGGCGTSDVTLGGHSGRMGAGGLGGAGGESPGGGGGAGLGDAGGPGAAGGVGADGAIQIEVIA